MPFLTRLNGGLWLGAMICRGSASDGYGSWRACRVALRSRRGQLSVRVAAPFSSGIIGVDGQHAFETTLRIHAVLQNTGVAYLRKE